MSAKFARQGIAFPYPENWTLEQDGTETGWIATLQSPATAFLTVTFDAAGPGIGEIADAALEALREVYPDLEAEEAKDTIGGLPAIGYDVEIF